MRRLWRRGQVLVLVLAALLGSGPATAATYRLDEALSSITLTPVDCLAACDGDLIVSLTPAVAAFSWSPSAVGDRGLFNDLFQWTIVGTTLQTFDVALELVFRSPDPQRASASGDGFYFSLLGRVSGARLVWDRIGPFNATVAFLDGSAIGLTLQDVTLFLETAPRVTSGAEFTLVSASVPAAVPLPAAGVLMLAGLGGLGVAAWRQKRRLPGPAARRDGATGPVPRPHGPQTFAA
jgi:hypothetical protein